MFLCFLWDFFIMGKVIAVIQKKGGATKTTTTLNLAGALIEHGYNVKVGDIDTEQQSATKWAKRGEIFKNIVFQISDKKIGAEIVRLKADCDFLLLDTPPELLVSAFKAALLSDCLIIPCQASTLDLDEAEETVDLAQTVQKPYWFLASNIKKGTTIGKQLPKTLRKIGNVFNTIIHNKVSIVGAAVEGSWIGAYKPNSEGHIEFKNLANELIDITRGIKHEQKTKF